MMADIYDFKRLFTLHKTVEETDLEGPPTLHFVLRCKGGRRLGVFPSSFNPLTTAHVELIDKAAQKGKLDEILLVLDKRTTDKPLFGATLEDRLLMLTLFARDKPNISIALSSHGLFVDKLMALKQVYPSGTEIFFIVGYDTIIRVLDEKYYQDREVALNQLFEGSRFLVANRREKNIKDIHRLFELKENEKYRDKIDTFQISPSLAEVSSTQVRRLVKEGESIGHLVPPEVDLFIRETRLYAQSNEYELRTKVLRYLFALHREPVDVELRRAIRLAKSPTPLGENIRRVIEIPPDSIPKRPVPIFPSDPYGDFGLLSPCFSLEEAGVEAQRCLFCKTPLCEKNCLAGVKIKEILSLVAEGKMETAYQRLKETHPLCGLSVYLCQTKEKYCEHHCLSGKIFGEGGEVAIQAVLRTIWRYGIEHIKSHQKRRVASIGRKIAVVGSGPAGLSAAIELARSGYQVTVFEQKPLIGGVPRYQIPPFRFPAEEVFARIEEDIRAMGIEVVTGVKIGVDLTIEDLKKSGYKAIFLATGLTKPKRLGIPGEGLQGVLTSVDLFERYQKEGVESLIEDFNGKRVYVTDSGNTAMDTSRFLRRLGADVTAIYWRDKPRALPKETRAAQREGVKLLLSTQPIEFVGDGGRLTHIRAVRADGTELKLPADFVIHAIGAEPEFRLEGLQLNPEGHIVVDQKTLETSLPGVYAGGDVVERGNISTAIRDGLKFAIFEKNT